MRKVNKKSDVERDLALINNVRNYPCLYDRHVRNTNTIKSAWAEIVKLMEDQGFEDDEGKVWKDKCNALNWVQYTIHINDVFIFHECRDWENNDVDIGVDA